MPHRSSVHEDLKLVWVVLVWGINIPIMKVVLRVMPPHAMNFFRLWLAALTIGFLYRWSQRRAGGSFLAPVRAHPWLLSGLGVIGFLLFQVSMIAGVSRTAAGNAALILASAPIWTAALGHALRIDRIGAVAWAGLLFAFAGAAVVIFGGSKTFDFTDATFVGNLLMLVAAICWSLYTVLSKPLTRRMHSNAVVFFSLVLVLPLLSLVGAWEFGAVPWSAVTRWHWAAVAFSGILSIGLNHALWVRSVKILGPSHTAIYGNLVPVVAMVSAILLLGEPITPPQVAGGALILTGLFVLRRSRERPDFAVSRADYLKS